MTSERGELTSILCSRPSNPLRPGLIGSSKTVRRPLPFGENNLVWRFAAQFYWFAQSLGGIKRAPHWSQ
jgi:hypothetical protein